MRRIRIKDNRFVDEHGRHVILHGISMVCKDKTRNYIGDWNETDFAKLKEWGFNVIRLGMIWDGIEPEPGKYDDHYLASIRRWVKMAALNDLHVILDMHQDLYSCLYADGAPAWATFSGDAVYTPTDLWSDAYLFDSAVQLAFDHFWNNSPASDGIGIQDHYIAAWQHVTTAFRDEPNVIGYDMMNEPFIGSEVQSILYAMFSTYADIFSKHTGQDPPSMDELLEIWSDPERKLQALGLLENMDAYQAVMKATSKAQAGFESGVLSPFFQKTGNAIRKADQDGILFMETNYFSNMGVSSAISPITDHTGARDHQQAYAPHGYDLVTDSDYVHAANHNRVSYIFEQHEATRERLKMPMIIGEWGAYGDSAMSGEASLHIQKIFEKLLCSDIYWCYLYPEMDRYSSFTGVQRGYPVEVAGEIISYTYDHAASTFMMEWKEDTSIQAPTRIYFPHLEQMRHGAIELTPPENKLEWKELKGTPAGWVLIHPTGSGKRSIKIG